VVFKIATAANLWKIDYVSKLVSELSFGGKIFELYSVCVMQLRPFVTIEYKHTIFSYSPNQPQQSQLMKFLFTEDENSQILSTVNLNLYE
jgi:hypothetical protein